MFSFIYFNGNNSKWSVHGGFTTEAERNTEAKKLWERNGCYGCDTVLLQHIVDGNIITMEMPYQRYETMKTPAAFKQLAVYNGNVLVANIPSDGQLDIFLTHVPLETRMMMKRFMRGENNNDTDGTYRWFWKS